MQMKNIRYILIFCLALLLFNWPVLSIAGSGETDIFFLYLFSVWMFIIVLIFVNGLTRSDMREESPAEHAVSSGPDRADHV